MSRYYNPINRYWANDGSILAFGTVTFNDSGTGAALAIFHDSAQEIKAKNPADIDATGRILPVFYEGTADVIVRNAADEIQDQTNPVGDEQSAGEFSLWNPLITYTVGSIVKGSDGKFYISLVNPNVNADPIAPSPANWSEIRFLGMWNASQTYAAGVVVQDSDGNLWKSLLAANLNNDPTTDGGTYWKLATANLWINKSGNFTIIHGKRYSIDGSGGTVDGALPASVPVGEMIIVHNESVSTNLVRLTNSALTIKGPAGTVTSSDNLVLAAGDTATLVAITVNILEVV